MPEISKDVISLLQYLAPGFVLAWVYYGLTSQIKQSQFERIVQALIFTVVIQAVVFIERAFSLWIGKYFTLGAWTANSDVVASLVTALVLGVVLSKMTNNDSFHEWIRKHGISTRSAHPCEWFGIFSKYPRFVVLHLKDGTLIYGWPAVWPSEYEKGHFFMKEVVRSYGEEDQNLTMLEGILIDVKDVSSVEFLKEPEKENAEAS